MELGSRLLSAPAPSLLSGQTHVHEHGLALTTRLGRTRRVHRWEHVTDLWYDVTMRITHDQARGSVVTQKTRKLTFGFDGAEKVTVRLQEAAVRTLARDFFGYGIRPLDTSAAETAAEHVRGRVAAAQLPSVKKRIAAGQTVAFGAVSVTADELHYQGQSLPWRKVSWLGFLHRYSSKPPVDGGGFARISYDLDTRWFNVPAADVSNLQTLEQFYDSLPRRRERQPVTGAYEPPGGEHSVGTLYLRCPACGVISGGRKLTCSTGDDGDYVWPIEYECACGHSGRLARQDVLPRDSEWTCTRPGCDTLFAVPTGAPLVTCPVCRTGHRTQET